MNSIIKGFTTALKGLSITFKHLFAAHSQRKVLPASDANYFKNLEGTNTIQYPHQQLPVSPKWGVTSWMWKWMTALCATFVRRCAR